MKRIMDVRLFFRYVSCNVLGMIGLSCYILADTYFVSRATGSDGLAALNFAIPMYTLMSATGLMLGVGGATRATILYAQKETDRAAAIFPNVFFFGLALSLVFVLLGLFAATPLAKLLGASGAALPLTIPYLRILLLYAPAFLLNQILLAFVRNDNHPSLAMIAMLAGSFSNVVLDYVFMFPLRMGMEGAAIATGIAPILGILILSLHFLRRNRTLRFVRCAVRLREIGCALRLGVSAWITEISSGVALLALNWIILKISGNLGVAAYGIIANIALVETAIYTGIAQGTQPLISRAHGSGEDCALRQYRNFAFLLALLLSAVLYLALLLWTEPIVKVFNTAGNTALAAIAKQGIRIYFTGFFFAGINIVLAASLSAENRPMTGLWISLLRGFLLLLPFAFVLSRIGDMTGVWLAFPMAESVTLGFGIVAARKSIFKKRLS